MNSQRFLFLQSHPSSFGRHLITELRQRGFDCRIINFSFSDWVYRFGMGADNYRGRLSNWRDYLERYIDKYEITDIVFYADQRPYHRVARAVGQACGIPVYAYEFGYLRPDWLTLEPGGMGPFSHFLCEPDQIKRLAEGLPSPDLTIRFRHKFSAEALNEVFYNIAPVFFSFLYPFFQRDRYYHPLVDYPSYIPRLFRSGENAERADQLIDELVESGVAYFLVPMQLQADYQIRRASSYAHLRDMVREVVGSFLKKAHSDTKLIFKIHPMDNNVERWPVVIQSIAQEFGCAGRIEIIDGGDLSKLVAHAQGVVLVNSTVGLQALGVQVPVKVLGVAVYDVAGMTFQGPLDDFWTNTETPDAELVDAFIRLLAAYTQVKGSFFDHDGQVAAVDEFIRRLTQEKAFASEVFVNPPPRLAKAMAMKVPMIFEPSKE